MNGLVEIKFGKWLASLSMLLVLMIAGCGGGPETKTNIDTDGETPTTGGSTGTGVSPYTGPVPLTADVLRFKTEFFDEYRASNRCGSCHNSGGQAPQFVREDNVNQAYSEALTVVDLNSPGASDIVAKVGGGHNCWSSSDAVCATEMTRAIEAWAGLGGSGSTEIELRAPVDHSITVTKQLPVTGSSDYSAVVSAFGSTIHPLFTDYGCDGCHRSNAPTPQQPYFASTDLNEAYDAARSKIDIDDGALDRLLNEALSRFVVRMRSEFHNCGNDCVADAQEMLDEINAFESMVPSPSAIPDNWVTSKALVLEQDGILASGGGRVDEGAIAKWDFSEGSGLIAGDSSGVEPQMQLNLDGNVSWVGGNGIQILSGGKAYATTATSKKLADNIKVSGAYSIEAWLAPANVTQEGPARIITYSAGTTERNFTLGQTLYNYDFLHRSSTTDANGEAALSTADADEALQATLQHVVVTFDPVNGRKIYVNGAFTDDIDSAEGGSLSGWDDSFVFILGNEASGDRQWEGILRFVAVYDRVLTDDEITTNFDAGVGEKYYLLFKLEQCDAAGNNCVDLTGINDDFDSYVVFETSIFDSYSYLFSEPFLYRIEKGTAPDPAVQDSYSNIPLEGMRIGINGKEPNVGQAYSKLQTTLDSTLYTDDGQVLSSIGTILAMEGGSNSDEFFLTFELIGSNTDVRVEGTVSPVAPTASAQEPDIGLRNFAEINASMSVITGVPVTNSNVVSTYNTVKQQLPTSSSAESFLSAHQMAVAQMAIEYCSELVDNTALRDSFFPGFISNFSVGVSAAFDTTVERDAIVDPLYANVMGSNIASQPDETAAKTELDDLITLLASRHGSGTSTDTQKIVKATCAAALGSAAVLVQ
jgi:hypothetical protein